MRSLKELYIIGPGPSSSHTIGPFIAATQFKKLIEIYKIDKIVVTLYGSLSLTGRGHQTDKILIEALKEYKVQIVFNNTEIKAHPNTLKFSAYSSTHLIEERNYASVGGGSIVDIDGKKSNLKEETYPFKSNAEMLAYMETKGYKSYVDLVNEFEDKTIKEYLKSILSVMFDSVERGLTGVGQVRAGYNLLLDKVAGKIYSNALTINDQFERRSMLISSFAYAVLEENASGHLIVTAPTCGSSGVLASNLYYAYKYNNINIDLIVEGLMVAGVIGNLFKTNASISGAVHGCQAEIGVATSMTAAALSHIYGLSLYQIEYASELAMEHSLGLTCDPVDGFVAIPCIERNGVAALRAYEAYLYAKEISKLRHNSVSLDQIVHTMKITGEALSNDYKETSIGGISKAIKK
ncbi:MAG: L-serine ammonia-lyase, iron-sulfur-dependent, subunit alpha [Bacilli bacterium]